MRFGYLAGAYGRLVRALRSKEGFRVSVASVGLAGLLMVLVTGAGLRAFDRALISGDYVIPLFYLPKVWVAHWSNLAFPATHPLGGYDLDTWWSTGPR